MNTQNTYNSPENEDKKVLVVEDDFSVRLLLRETLQRQGLKVIEAGDGNEALEKAIAETPHLITMDERLPGMLGTEVAKQLKTKDETRHIPIIAITANLDAEIAQDLHKHGFAHYIPKPFRLEDITNIIHNFI